MGFSQRYQEKQIRLTVFDNEPTARLAEQRLRQEGIRCFTRSLGVGHGAWGTAYNLPHALYVYQADALRAREALDLAPLEMAEREKSTSRRTGWSVFIQSLPHLRGRRAGRLVAPGLIIAVLAFGVIAFLLSHLAK